MTLTIRAMGEEDLEEVLEVERQTFSDPWTPGMFREELARGLPSLSLVAREEGRLVGYLNAMAVYDELHIGNLAVRAADRGQGTGERLLARALDHARAHGLGLATLEVRMTNEAAIRLYQKFGFQPAAIRKRYYGREDALVMVLDLAPRSPSAMAKG